MNEEKKHKKKILCSGHFISMTKILVSTKLLSQYYGVGNNLMDFHKTFSFHLAPKVF